MCVGYGFFKVNLCVMVVITILTDRDEACWCLQMAEVEVGEERLHL